MSTAQIDPSLLTQAEKIGVTIVPGAPPTSREFVVNGLRLHSLDWGNEGAPVILFLHGGSQTAHMWDFSALALRDRYHCIALDQRGHGDSDWAPDGDYSLEKHQQDIEGFITAMDIAPLYLVGLSMGGQNSTVLTANHADWVQKLVIVDVGPEVQDEGIREIRSFTSLPDEVDSFEEFVERVTSYSNLRPVEQIRASLKNNVKQLPSGKWTWKTDKALRDPSRTRERPPTEYLWECVSKITCPTLIVRGGVSKVFAEETGKRMVAAMANARMVTIEKADHRVPGDNPVGFERALVGFLDGS